MYDVASLNVSILLSFLSTGSVGIRPLKCAKAPLTLELIGLFYSMMISPYYINMIVTNYETFLTFEFDLVHVHCFGFLIFSTFYSILKRT